MTNFADFSKSDPLYDQEAQENYTQMTNFTDLPKSDSLNGRKQEKSKGLVGNVKKQKRLRKRGKWAKKDSVCDFERVTVCDCDKRGDRARVAYLKDEIEALRYEYDCLVVFKDGCDGDGNYVSFDVRTQFGNKKGASSGNEPDQMDHVSGVNDDDLDVEEDYYEDEYSDSKYVSIQRPAFYVT
uniref:Uncharacterized protein n=1 Tax=Tanacetum cinerariifolium TaxID=118510 RepID=A0A699JB92_TANCI|nr:hypothetical protein [Tanacetum cinerariifolium]